MDEAELDQKSIEPESLPDSIHINYESGKHKPSLSPLVEEISQGNLTDHLWNSEVADRVYGSGILGIDSVSPGDLSLRGKKKVWAALPASPSELNDSGEAMVVAGDASYYHLEQVAQEADTVTRKQLRDKLYAKVNAEMNDQRLDYAKELAAESIGAGIILQAAVLAYDKVHPVRQVVKEAEHTGGKGMSRRDFLKRTAAGLGIAAVAGTRMGSRAIATHSPHEQIADIAERIHAVASTGLFDRNVWLSGRTALLIAKTREAVEEGYAPDGLRASVVMGESHTIDAQQLMDSAEARGKAMTAYYKEMNSFMEEVLTALPDIPREDALQMMDELFVSADLLRVTDGGDIDLANVSNPDEFIDSHVESVGRVRSSEALSALKNAKTSNQPSYF